jgi:hypothetical protein
LCAAIECPLSGGAFVAVKGLYLFQRHALDTRLYSGYITILAPVKDMARRHTVSWERGRCPRAALQAAPGRLGYQPPGILDRDGRCIPGRGQAKAGNARADHVPGSLA